MVKISVGEDRRSYEKVRNMLENNKTEEFLQKLVPCIDRSDLETCVKGASLLAWEMGIGAGLMLGLSSKEIEKKRYDLAYILTLVAAQDMNSESKAWAYSNAGIAAMSLGKLEKAEECYEKSIKAHGDLRFVYSNYAVLLEELGRNNEAEEYYKAATGYIMDSDPYYGAHQNYAKFFEKLNKKTEANGQYKEACRLNSMCADFNDKIRVLHKVGAKPYSESGKLFWMIFWLISFLISFIVSLRDNDFTPFIVLIVFFFLLYNSYPMLMDFEFDDVNYEI